MSATPNESASGRVQSPLRVHEECGEEPQLGGCAKHRQKLDATGVGRVGAEGLTDDPLGCVEDEHRERPPRAEERDGARGPPDQSDPVESLREGERREEGSVPDGRRNVHRHHPQVNESGEDRKPRRRVRKRRRRAGYIVDSLLHDSLSSSTPIGGVGGRRWGSRRFSVATCEPRGSSSRRRSACGRRPRRRRSSPSRLRRLGACT